MADDEIEPALTLEQWRKAHGELQVDAGGVIYWGTACFSVSDDPSAIEATTPEGDTLRHTLAALCLYQQPFGFEQEDVSVLQSVLARLDEGGKRHARIASLKARICALLPPAPSPFPCPWCPSLDANTDETVLIQHLQAKHCESML